MIIERALINWPNFLMVGFVAVLMVSAAHLATSGR